MHISAHRTSDRYAESNNIVIGQAGSLPASLAVSGPQVAEVLAAALQQAQPRKGYTVEVAASGDAPPEDVSALLGQVGALAWTALLECCTSTCYGCEKLALVHTLHRAACR